MARGSGRVSALTVASGSEVTNEIDHRASPETRISMQMIVGQEKWINQECLALNRDGADSPHDTDVRINSAAQYVGGLLNRVAK